jgi:hypothetical protein
MLFVLVTRSNKLVYAKPTMQIREVMKVASVGSMLLNNIKSKYLGTYCRSGMLCNLKEISRGNAN